MYHNHNPRMYDWEPMLSEDYSILPHCLKRIEKDIKDITKNPPQGIFALPDEDNVRLMRVMITGPSGTPYHGGMFSFRLGFANDYPMKPPKVKCLTTDGDKVRFNPNIYENGKVCLSILGTWDGPGWSPVMNLSCVVVSIQSLMNEEPYRNEPGYDKASDDEVRDYNYVIQHETIRVAVIDVMENIDTYHEYFAENIRAIFNQYYDRYIKVCKENMCLDGKAMNTDFYVDNGRKFHFESMLHKLEYLKEHASE